VRFLLSPKECSYAAGTSAAMALTLAKTSVMVISISLEMKLYKTTLGQLLSSD
jgi:hypothetical protein